jgi:hypothetical protein
MNSHSRNNQIAIFSAAMLREPLVWKQFISRLPSNACLIILDPHNSRQAQVMRPVVKAFSEKGRPVHFWMFPRHA